MAELDLYDDILVGNLSPARERRAEVLLELGTRRLVLHVSVAGCPLQTLQDSLGRQLQTQQSLRQEVAGGRLVFQRLNAKFDTWVDLAAGGPAMRDGERLRALVVPQLEAGEVVTSSGADSPPAQADRAERRHHRRRHTRSSGGRHRRHKRRRRSSSSDGGERRRRRPRHSSGSATDSDRPSHNGTPGSRDSRTRSRRRRSRARQSSESRARQGSESRPRQGSESRARQGSEVRARQSSESRARQRSEARARQSSESLSGSPSAVSRTLPGGGAGGSSGSGSPARARSPPAPRAPPAPIIGPVGRAAEMWRSMDPDYANELCSYQQKRIEAAEKAEMILASDGDHSSSSGEESTPFHWKRKVRKTESELNSLGDSCSQARRESAGHPRRIRSSGQSSSRSNSENRSNEDKSQGNISQGQLYASYLGLLSMAGKNPVMALHEYCTARQWPAPVFQVTDAPGDHKQQHFFKCNVKVDGKMYDSSQLLRSKKEAKRDAADHCLRELGVVLKQPDATSPS